MILKILGKIFLKLHKALNRIRSIALLSSFKSVGSHCFVEWPLKISNGKYITLGKGVAISWNGWLYANDRYGDQHFTPDIVIGDYTYIGNACHIVACNSIRIGKNVLIADRCYLSDNLHDYQDVSCSIFDNKLLVPGKIEIGDDSWIGENVCIYGNVTVGKHCVVGANSVLTKDIPDYSVAVGAPARIVKQYDLVTQQWRKIDGNKNLVEVSAAENQVVETVSWRKELVID